MSFTYKAVDGRRADRSHYFLATRTAGGYGNDKAFPKRSGATGGGRTKTIDITLGDFDDHCMIWGIDKHGALAVDDIKIVKQ